MANPTTRITLLQRLGDHRDREAWATFIAIYQPLMQRLLGRWGVVGSDAEEVIQEVLTAVSQAIKEYQYSEHRGAFRGWLSTITRNKMIDLLRKRDRFPQPIGGTDFQQWLCDRSDPSCSDRWELEQRREVFQWAAAEVSRQVQPRTWQAFELSVLGGLPAAEVAEQLDAQIGWVYVARSRVLARLKELVATLGEDPAEERE